MGSRTIGRFVHSGLIQVLMARFLRFVIAVFAAISMGGPAAVAQESAAFRQAVAEAAAGDRVLLNFYRDRNFTGLWIGSGKDERARRAALLATFDEAADHGLPAARYDSTALEAKIRNARSQADLGQIDVELSRVFLSYARDIQTGVLVPGDVVEDIKRRVPHRDRGSILDAFSKSTPTAFIRTLPPQSEEYARLLKAKFDLEQIVAAGDWGAPVYSEVTLRPGDSSDAVLALRNRLIRMGYMRRTASAVYDGPLQEAVQRFQLDHGLNPDGIAGQGTLGEVNVTAAARLQSIFVAMERERWSNQPLGDRHIWVNLTDFTAKIVDNGEVTFVTRSVVGANVEDQRSPEFSDRMEYMVLNPGWYVPRSIIVKEYLPLLQEDPLAVSNLEITREDGSIVERLVTDFSAFDETTFPFGMREPPSQGNALGEVKFMFPNPYNIYLHDTPSQSLFAKEVRAFSHGCIRLDDPRDFAYALLAKQVSDPISYYASMKALGDEIEVRLEQPVPVHIDYRTAFTTAAGGIEFRRDIYGRDAKIWDALAREGVAVRAVRG
jgi:murein L,D-transpeptidase YcbB/YkuD